MAIPECQDEANEDCGDLTWKIESKEGPRTGTVSYDETTKATSISAFFTEANTNFIVTVSDMNSNVLLEVEGTVKYVRREIRTLTEKDRTAFFQALKTVFTVSTEDGKALYGDKYLSHSHLTALHDRNDVKYHGNLFFLTSHPTMQIKCDMALLAVDKTVTLAYWDFVQDSHLGKQ